MLKQAFASLRQFWNNEKGVALAFVAAFLFALVGVAALAIDVGQAYFWRQQMQSAADAAATSGALALSKSQDVMLNGKAVAASFAPGFAETDSNGASTGVIVTINCNVATANCAGATTTDAGDKTAVEAIITRPMSTTFANLFAISAFNVGARALAKYKPLKYCILALNPTGTAISANGGVDFGNPNCGIADNSASNPATDIKGGGTISGQFTVTGAMNRNGNNYSFPEGYTENTGSPVPDPYADNGQKDWVLGTNATWTTNWNAYSTKWNNNKSNFMPNNSSWTTNWGPNAPSKCRKSGATPNCIPGSCPSRANYCTVTTTPPSSGNHYVDTLGNGGTLNTGTSYVNTAMSGGTISGTAYVNGTMSGGTISGAAYVNIMSGGTITNAAGAVSYVTTLSSGTLTNAANTSTFYVNSISGGTLNNSANGTIYANTVTGGTINNGASGTFYANSVSGANTRLSGGTFYINTLSGGTLSDGVFYVNSLTGSVTSTHATLVIMHDADIGNQSLTLQAPTSNTGAASNKGLALVSPNAITIGFGGNSDNSIQGAIYAPNWTNPNLTTKKVTGSLVYMRGTVNAQCAQVIAGAVDIGGNVNFDTDATCGVTNITNGGSVRLAE